MHRALQHSSPLMLRPSAPYAASTGFARPMQDGSVATTTSEAQPRHSHPTAMPPQSPASPPKHSPQAPTNQAPPRNIPHQIPRSPSAFHPEAPPPQTTDPSTSSSPS